MTSSVSQGTASSITVTGSMVTALRSPLPSTAIVNGTAITEVQTGLPPFTGSVMGSAITDSMAAPTGEAPLSISGANLTPIASAR